jgi:hypothetical protein
MELAKLSTFRVGGAAKMPVMKQFLLWARDQIYLLAIRVLMAL